MGWRALAVALALVAVGCTGTADDDGGGNDPNRPDANAPNPAPNPDDPDAMPGSGDNADAAPVAGEPAELLGITNAHNQVRAAVGVAPLVWDDDLAAVAQAWADQCIDNQSPAGLIDHNPGRSDNYPGYVGENIYGHSGQATGIGAVSSWASEEQNYDYASNTCSGICGHYTQIVWAATLRLGCAYNDCAGLQFGSSVVCNYSPGGNNGDRPY